MKKVDEEKNGNTIQPPTGGIEIRIDERSRSNECVKITHYRYDNYVLSYQWCVIMTHHHLIFHCFTKGCLNDERFY